MDITFCGAAQMVTGSCSYLELPHCRLLVDCGMQQGHDVVDNHTFPFDPARLDAVLLTHCHMDHCGRLPLLVRRGYTGYIYMTDPTAQLLHIMLRDHVRLHLQDVQYHNKKHAKNGLPPEEPLYEEKDVEETLRRIRIVGYHQWQTVHEGVRFCFHDAGHMLGSAQVELQYLEQDGLHRLLCSGDLGNCNMPLLGNPQQHAGADAVILECTHGDHCYLPYKDYTELLAGVLDETFRKGGSVLIPAAAVGRTQELLYCLHQLRQQRAVPSLPDFPVYVDSPMAENACSIFSGDDLDNYLDADAWALKQRDGSLLDFEDMHLCLTSEDSKELNHDARPKVIIAANSMCEGGRIRHHLKHHLWRKECTLVLLGHPRRGTLGHELLSGVETVQLMGDEIPVHAKILELPVRPTHADAPALLHWLQELPGKPKQVFLNHADAVTAQFFAQALQQEGYNVHVPHFGETVHIL